MTVFVHKLKKNCSSTGGSISISFCKIQGFFCDFDNYVNVLSECDAELFEAVGTNCTYQLYVPTVDP